MGVISTNILVICIYYPFLVVSISIDSLYLDFVHRNISDFKSFDRFYRDLLQGVRQHRSIDTVSSPINLEKIQTNDYNEDYLKTSCYATATDLLYVHGYNKTALNLSINDLQSLLPAVLYSVENPGCQRQLPPSKQYAFFDIWILGLVFIVIMKLIHLLIFIVTGDHSSVLTFGALTRAISPDTDMTRTPTGDVRFAPIKYHLWLGLGFNAFTCGIILGTVGYHLIPHIYETPNEDFNYTYLLRGTVVLCGVFLFFIVEKLLRFRFKVDDTHFDEPAHINNETADSSDAPMIHMAKMHGTIHVHGRDHIHHTHLESPVRLSSVADDIVEETGLQVDLKQTKREQHSFHSPSHEQQTRRLILYHIIYDFSNDIIYGCGLSTALAHDRLIGFVLWLMIFNEGFRRHSELLSSLGRKLGFAFLFFSVVFLILGYIIGAILIEINQQFSLTLYYIPKEYVYSTVYGALFYTALVILIPELNDFGQHLQVSAKTVKQSIKQRRLLQMFIFICQNLFLLIGVLIALLLAIIWRYHHRKYIYEYICQQDPSRIICRFSS